MKWFPSNLGGHLEGSSGSRRGGHGYGSEPLVHGDMGLTIDGHVQENMADLADISGAQLKVLAPHQTRDLNRPN